MLTEADVRRAMLDFESEGLDFKREIGGRDGVKSIAEDVAAIANWGGGVVYIGVTDAKPRQIVDQNNFTPDDEHRFLNGLVNRTSHHCSVERVPSTDGVVLALHVPRRPRGTPVQTSDGKFLTRLGQSTIAMTVAQVDSIRREAGVDRTREPIPMGFEEAFSPVALESLRKLARETGAPDDLLQREDRDLLEGLNVLTADGKPTVAALLIAGRSEVIRDLLPHAQWQFRRMRSDLDYELTESGYDAIPVALRRLRELIDANNPVITIKGDLFHAEFPRYPKVALRELLANALVHRDIDAPGSVFVKQYPGHLEVSNPGGFVGGITADNILHHPSTPRYPLLMEALTRLRLTNASNLGVPRIFYDLLREGKQPPIYEELGGTVRVTIQGQEASPTFVKLVSANPDLTVDHLMILHYLARHREITAKDIAQITQRSVARAGEIASELAVRFRLIERAGSGSGRYFRLTRGAYESLSDELEYDIDKRLTLANAKARVLEALADRSLTNAEIREITQLDRQGVLRMMEALAGDGLVLLHKAGRFSRWERTQ